MNSDHSFIDPNDFFELTADIDFHIPSMPSPLVVSGQGDARTVALPEGAWRAIQAEVAKGPTVFFDVDDLRLCGDEDSIRLALDYPSEDAVREFSRIVGRALQAWFRDFADWAACDNFAACAGLACCVADVQYFSCATGDQWMLKEGQEVASLSSARGFGNITPLDDDVMLALLEGVLVMRANPRRLPRSIVLELTEKYSLVLDALGYEFLEREPRRRRPRRPRTVHLDRGEASPSPQDSPF